MSASSDTLSFEVDYSKYVAARKRRWESSRKEEESEEELTLRTALEARMRGEARQALDVFNASAPPTIVIKMSAFNLIHPTLATITFTGSTRAAHAARYVASRIPWFAKFGIELQQR